MQIKTIGVLTSGGDAPGMNAAIRSVVRTAIYRGMNVKGIVNGYEGLFNKEVIDMTDRSVSDIIHRGGTVLGTARSEKFKTKEGVKEAAQCCRELGIDGIVVIGGDGSFRGARDLSLEGIPCVGIPGTIDNDIASTEYTIGFDTAMNTACEMTDRLRDTAQSHHRCSVVEVMGRHAGYLAYEVGTAVGATAILVPEIEYDLQKDVIDRMNAAKEDGKKHFIIVVAENLCDTNALSKEIEEKTGVETRPTILGHIQRGGNPTVRDRVMATKMGFYAVELLKDGIGNRVVAYKNGEILNYDIYEALNMKKTLNADDLHIAHRVSR